MKTIQEMGAELQATHGAGNVAAVHYDGTGTGVAFFRRPTAEEYDGFAVYADDADVKRKAYADYVKRCFVCSLDGTPLDAIINKAGPAWIQNAAGAAVNKLSGSKGHAPTVFF